MRITKREKCEETYSKSLLRLSLVLAHTDDQVVPMLGAAQELVRAFSPSRTAAAQEQILLPKEKLQGPRPHVRNGPVSISSASDGTLWGEWGRRSPLLCWTCLEITLD